MKFISFITPDKKERLGLEVQGKPYEGFATAQRLGLEFPKTMKHFLEDTNAYLPIAQKMLKAIESDLEIPSATVATPLSPIPHPSSCRDGYAFRQHVETMRRNRGLDIAPEFDQFPVFYFTNHQAIIGEGPVEVQDDHLRQLDYELEVAIVIGKKGRNISADRADDYILGYTIMNDFSARLLQIEEMKLSLGPAKGKDFATALGPCLVTRDELAPYARSTPQGERLNLEMSCLVNGTRYSQGNLSSMHWTFAQIIERVSYGADIFPGDVIGSGTVGTGCLAEINSTAARSAKESGKPHTPVWLQDGDQIEMSVQGLGTLKNTIKRRSSPYGILDYLNQA